VTGWETPSVVSFVVKTGRISAPSGFVPDMGEAGGFSYGSCFEGGVEAGIAVGVEHAFEGFRWHIGCSPLRSGEEKNTAAGARLP
jgi:hypothetical protein